MSGAMKERRRAHYLARKIIEFLKDDDEYLIQIKRLTPKIQKEIGLGPGGRLYGYVDPWAEIIFIDFRYNVIVTLIHEVLHILYPDGHEYRDIRKMENIVMRHLTSSQAKLMWYHASHKLAF